MHFAALDRGPVDGQDQLTKSAFQDKLVGHNGVRDFQNILVVPLLFRSFVGRNQLHIKGVIGVAVKLNRCVEERDVVVHKQPIYIRVQFWNSYILQLEVSVKVYDPVFAALNISQKD